MPADEHLDRIARAAASTTGRNPSTVLEAFVPSSSLTVTLADLLRLERIGSPLLTGGTPRLSDLLIAYGVLTDWPSVERAYRKRRLDDWIDAFAATLPANAATAIAQAVTEAIQAAFAPVQEAAASSDSEKKMLDADGGSPSAPLSPTTTAGPLT